MGVVNGIAGIPDQLEALKPHLARGVKTADEYACRIIELLESIDGNTGNLWGADVYESPGWAFTGADTKEWQGRQGYAKVVKRIAIVAAGAVDVDLFVVSTADSGFRERVSLTAAGRTARALEVPVPEGASVFAVTSAAAQVNLVLKRIEL